MQLLKQKLYAVCLQDTEERISELKLAIDEARDAQQNDTKSSAGDKFETTREMMTQRIETLSIQLREVEAQRSQLMSLVNVSSSAQVQVGCIVLTSAANFYISISAGTKTCEGQKFVCISASSPLGSLLLGKKAGERIDFNQKQYLIEQIL